MATRLTSFIGSFTSSSISCTPDELVNLLEDESISTEQLSEDVLLDLQAQAHALRAYQRDYYQQDEFLTSILEFAPTPIGKRYVAASLYLAQQKGTQTVVALADAWMKHLFLPMWTISTAYFSNYYNEVQSPPYPHGTALTDIPSLSQLEIMKRDVRNMVATRERYRCGITRTFDVDRAQALIYSGRAAEIPKTLQEPMDAAPIIPFLLDINSARERNDVIICGVKINDELCTWSMLRSWAGFDIGDAIGSSNIHTPSNTIYMSLEEHLQFRRFYFYLDKNVFPNVPNKYKIHIYNPQMLFPGRMGASQDVEFPTYAETSIDPPSAALLGLHAAYAKVLHACGDPTRELVRTFGEKAVRYQQMLDDLRFNGREHPWKGDDLLTDTPIIL